MVSSSSLVFTSSSCICFFMASSSSEAEAGAPSSSHLSRRALDWGAEGGHGPATSAARGSPARPRRRGSPGVPGDPHLEMLQLPPVILELPPFVLDLCLTFPLLLEGREQQSRGRCGEGVGAGTAGAGAPPSRPGQHPRSGEDQGAGGEGLPGGLTWGHEPCLGLRCWPWGQPPGSSPALCRVPALTGGN